MKSESARMVLCKASVFHTPRRFGPRHPKERRSTTGARFRSHRDDSFRFERRYPFSLRGALVIFSLPFPDLRWSTALLPTRVEFATQVESVYVSVSSLCLSATNHCQHEHWGPSSCTGMAHHRRQRQRRELCGPRPPGLPRPRTRATFRTIRRTIQINIEGSVITKLIPPRRSFGNAVQN